MSDALDTLAGMIASARRILAFTGAGISTESGIPDFRSPGGVWDRYAPIRYQDFLRDAESRRETWRRGLHTYPVVAGAQPNAAHLALVELERRGRLAAVVTQNIDGLHQKAGHDPNVVVELHGNAHRVRCIECGAGFEREQIHQRVVAGEEEPPCAVCGGTLKPSTVSFGEPMPVEAMRRAESEARACDLCLVIGSSLVVYPAAAVPEYAIQAGAPLAIVNATPTHLDDAAAAVLRGQAAVVLPQALATAADLS